MTDTRKNQPNEDDKAAPAESSILKFAVAVFALALIFNIAWMTGLRFRFTELALFPNYQSLAAAFAQGKTDIDNPPPEDFIEFQGRYYLYYGPAPAIARLLLSPITPGGAPTGFMVAWYCAGCAALFAALMRIFIPNGSYSTLFAGVFVLNGYGLFMVSVPSIHHEAIAMSMLFLLGALTLLFWSMRRARPPGVVEALAMAGLLGGALASRVSAFGACGIIGLVFLHDALLDMETGRRKLTPGVIVFTVAGLAAVGGILAYNYLRFGAALEFGAQYQESIYAEYYRAGLFMRYEHLPFNIWSYFFRLPAQVDQFPYLAAPFFMIKTQSVGFPPFTVMYGNELACAMFLVFPLAAAWCLPLFPSVSSLEGSPRAAYFIVLACCASQILTVSLANISAARFYYDFFPLVLLTCYLGVSSLKPAPAVSRRVRILALVSVGISAAIYINGFQYYAEAIQYSR